MVFEFLQDIIEQKITIMKKGIKLILKGFKFILMLFLITLNKLQMNYTLLKLFIYFKNINS